MQNKPFPDIEAILVLWKKQGSFPKEGREAISVLIECLRDEDTLAFRRASDALGKFGAQSYEAVPFLIPFLKHKSHYVRICALAALGKIGHAARDAIPAIRELIKEDPGMQFWPGIMTDREVSWETARNVLEMIEE